MKAPNNRVIVLSSGFALLAAIGAAWLGYSRLARASAIDCIVTWARLAPFPESAQQLRVSAEGGMFSRAFRATFVAPPADIDKWLRQSPGPHEATPTKPAAGVRHFQISPGGGAAHAEITVDDTKHQVSIRAYWS